MQALARTPTATHHDPAQSFPATIPRSGAIPFFEGALDEPVFGDGDAPFHGYLVTRPAGEEEAIMLPAGRLQGLGVGHEVALHDPTDPNGPALATAEVIALGVGDSRLKISDMHSDTPFTSLNKNLLAKPVSPPIRLGLTVGLPSGPKATGAEREMATAAVAVLQQSPERQRLLDLSFVSETEDADVYLRVEQGALWLLGPDAGWPAAADPLGRSLLPKVELSGDPEETAMALQLALRHQAQERNLISIASELSREALREKLKVEAFLLPDTSGAPSATPPDNRTCVPAVQDAIPAGAEPFDPLNAPDVYHCDQVYLRIVNESDKPLDIGLLYALVLDGYSSSQVRCRTAKT